MLIVICSQKMFIWQANNRLAVVEFIYGKFTSCVVKLKAVKYLICDVIYVEKIRH